MKLGRKVILGKKRKEPEKIYLKKYYETKPLKSFLKKKEQQERLNITDKSFLYPTLNDPNFNIKIVSKKEFHDTKYDDEIHDVTKHGEDICTEKEFELSPTQMFVRNFLSFQTPYNNLLLFHGLGVGKTCSAISVCEEMRSFMKQMGISKRIIIVASPNVQENFKLQLFDERKLKYIDGLWNMRACTGNSLIKEVNPMYMKGLPKNKVIRQIKRIIGSSYLFMGYTAFSNYISKVVLKYKKEKKAIRREFSNRLIVIDEVHNIRSTSDNKHNKKKSADNLLKLVSYTENLKLLLLSATPMFNSYKEIIWLLNLMNLNDNRFPISIKDIFDKDGNFLTDAEGNEIGKDLLIQKATGYVSFVRGENPYTFPYRIYPTMILGEPFSKRFKYPEKQINEVTILKGIQFLDIFMSTIGSFQEVAYLKIIESIKERFPSFSSMETGLGYTTLEAPLQVLNIAYPSSGKLYGAEGLEAIMKYDKGTKRGFSYRDETLEDYGRIFTLDEIEKYSGKIFSICQQIRKSKGIILIYSQYIMGGCVPLALVLEEMGFARYNNRSLFKTPPVKGEPIGYYVMITGDQKLSPQNKDEINACTNEDNINGEKVKIIIISKAGSEGLDFKNIRQVHILEPWYNLNRIEQIIGRAVRYCSHIKLPFEERNTEIYLYGTKLLSSDIEAADLYVYRLAERKAMQISIVTRILKETAVDCLLNKGQTHLSEERMNQTVSQNLSSGVTIDYNVGDHSHTAVCDYMKECTYSCNPHTDTIEINEDSYNEGFIIMNLEKIIQRIRNLMKEHYIYKKEDLISGINRLKKYPRIQIFAALSQLVNDKNEYITDMLGRIGHLVNIDEFYMFQPIELDNKEITRYMRVHPLEYKRKYLEISLPKQITKFYTTTEDIGKIVNEMHKKYLTILTPQKINKGEHNWYVYFSRTIQRLQEYIPLELLLKYALHHIVDSQYFYKRELIEYIYFKDILTDFEGTIKGYLDLSTIPITKKNNAILFVEDSKLSSEFEIPNWPHEWEHVKIGTKGEKTIRGILPNEFDKIKTKIGDIAKTDIAEMNNIIGFMGIFKNEYIIFMIKDLTLKRNKGARCDQSTKKNIIPLLESVNQERTYTNLVQKLADETKEKKISSHQLCTELEIILRYYDDIKKDGKRWFISPTDSILMEIRKKNKLKLNKL